MAFWRKGSRVMEINPQLDTSIYGEPPQAELRFFGRGRLPGQEKQVADRGVDLTRLFGHMDASGNQVRKYEKPWHRAAAYFWASGKMSLKAIAEACEVSYTSVLDLSKNAWFQETVNEIMRQNGAQDVMDLFKAEQFNSLVTLVELRDSPKAPAAVRRASAVDILDRYMGKPTQRVETVDTTPVNGDPVELVAQLERENARLRAPLNEHAVRAEEPNSLSLSA